MSLTWTIGIRSLTMGAGTDYPLIEPGVTGLGIPSIRANDQERGHLSGNVGGDDVLDRRVITIAVGINKTTASAAWTALTTLKTNWAPSYVDLALTFTMAGVTLVYYGRPRGLDADVLYMEQGWIPAQLTFEALVPFATGEAVDAAI